MNTSKSESIHNLHHVRHPKTTIPLNLQTGLQRILTYNPLTDEVKRILLTPKPLFTFRMPPKKQTPTKTVVVERVVTTKETRTTYQTKPKPEPKKSGACHRCGRTSHWIADCYARTNVDGEDISEEED